MRSLTLISVVLSVLFLLVFVFLGRSGMTAIQPGKQFSGFDGRRRAFLQTSAVVETGQAMASHTITIFGRSRDVSPPFLEVEFEIEQMTLQPSVGQGIVVPAGMKTAWRAASGEWSFSEESIGSLDGIPEKLLGDLDSDLFETLRQALPAKRAILDRIERDLATDAGPSSQGEGEGK